MAAKADYGPILGRIVESKRRELEEAQMRCDLQTMRLRAADSPAPRNFAGALLQPGRIGLIAEIKKASPSKGMIRENFDPVAIARSYVAGGAQCLSVLTDGPFFHGSAEIFEAVRDAVDLPMLRKEFMIDPYQFYEARAMGADAVLLITSILEDGQLCDFSALAGELGMAVLLETHSEADLRRALALLKPDLLGINNRDLQDANFRTDLAHTGRMMPLLREICPEALPPVVAESGIHHPSDVLRLQSEGVSAVLVGESLMRQPDPGAAARELMSLAGA